MKISATTTVTATAVLSVLLCGMVTAEMDFPALDHIVPSASPDTQTQAAADLIQRLVPKHAAKFSVLVDPSIGPKFKDTFKITNGGSGSPEVHITGTTGVGVAMGFYFYIKKFCNAHVSWAGDQVNLPDVLPEVPAAGITVTSNDRFRYYQNVCTVSYSMVWWTWARWEKEIDWMAMNGINFPLAFNGQEGIWNRVYLKMGFNQTELDAHFAGPAFFAWQRMGNMEGWGGPLSDNWHNQQMALQHQILGRMRSMGIIPVLPAFAGHVPKAITRVFPSANVSRLGDWNGFNQTYCCTTFLEATDSYFKVIGKAFLDEYIKEFGTDHVYNCDSFNEMTPRSPDPAYLKGAGAGVYGGMLASDPDAVWVMQGWLFLGGFWKVPQAKALLTSVPIGKMILLDLYSEVSPIFSRFESYYGQPFIWNMLHDFGGTVAMYGAIDSVNTGPFKGRAFPNSTMIGVGITPEGINQNDVMYEFMMENTWRKQPVNTSVWFSNYGMRRYGKYDFNVDKGWQLLLTSVYSTGQKADRPFVYRPSLPKQQQQQQQQPSYPTYYHSNHQQQQQLHDIWYDPMMVFEAWDHFIMAADGFTNSSLFRYDLVDVSRQSLQLFSTVLYHNMIVSAKANETQSFQGNATQFLTLLDDLDTLLATDVHFLLGRWIADARNLGFTDAEKDQFEMNARNQVTMWGPRGEINDYANKQWAGLVGKYYKARWALFITRVNQSLVTGTPFDQSAYNAEVLATVEQPFSYDKTFISPDPVGDQIEISKATHKKYRPMSEQNKEYLTNQYKAYIRDLQNGVFSDQDEAWNGLSSEMGLNPPKRGLKYQKLRENSVFNEIFKGHSRKL